MYEPLCIQPLGIHQHQASFIATIPFCVALACVRAIGVSSGVGIESSSGAISTKTASAGHSGVSGVLVFSSGTSSAGSSGSISIGSGASHGR